MLNQNEALMSARDMLNQDVCRDMSYQDWNQILMSW